MRQRLIASLILLLTTLVSYAQNANHAVGVQVGFTEPIYRLNSPSIMGKSSTKLNSTVLNGLKVGIVYDATLIKGFGMSMGLNYTFAMHNDKWSDYLFNDNPQQTPISSQYQPSIEYRTRYEYHQGEIFVDWQYKFTIAKQTYIILYTGPTIQCTFAFHSKDFYRTIQGHDDATLLYPVQSYEAQMDDYFHRLNVTWGIGAGFQYKRYFLRGGYDFGVINPYKKNTFNDFGFTESDGITGDDRLTRGRIDQWQIKIGCYFWQKEY